MESYPSTYLVQIFPVSFGGNEADCQKCDETWAAYTAAHEVFKIIRSHRTQ